MLSTTFFITVLVTLISLTAAYDEHSDASPYTLTDDLSYKNFFDGFDFYDGPDPTKRFVRYQNQEYAIKQNLVGYLEEESTRLNGLRSPSQSGSFSATLQLLRNISAPRKTLRLAPPPPTLRPGARPLRISLALGATSPLASKTSRLFSTLLFCGDWAGKEWEKDGCAKKTDVVACDAYVRDNPQAFMEAYWEVAGLKWFQKSAPAKREAAIRPTVINIQSKGRRYAW
jgi:hypothetical protein